MLLDGHFSAPVAASAALHFEVLLQAFAALTPKAGDVI